MFRFTTLLLIFIVCSLYVFSQCLDEVINAEFPNDLAIIGQDEVNYTAQGDLLFEIAMNIGDKFLLFKNNTVQPSGLIIFTVGDILKIVPNIQGTAAFAFFSDEVGCPSNWSELNTATIALPVTWLSLPTATIKNNQTHISWSIATQTINDKYIIEHSQDCKNFSPIGEIEGDGTSNETKHYEYIHTSPSFGMNYYRIKQVDYDGKYSYSDIASVKYDGSGETNIYPNPATSEVTITTTVPTSLQIMDVYGRVLSKQDISEGQNAVDISELPSGIYHLRINNQITKLIKL
jgi:hypothetical protein